MSTTLPQFCKKNTWANWGSYQCSRKPWKDGYCKQHHPDTVKSRDAKRSAKWDAENKRQQHAYRIEKARSKVAPAAMEWYKAGRPLRLLMNLATACSELDALESAPTGGGRK